ncbi:leucine-rich repeat protein [Butyrivibrio sp. AE3006]|uniref:leucine-rich repeat protein n=1 Tax=Butyrivibrio sp. AE3006 TaxID=1280673 RepID=UPI000417074D|nr:leucine-rich repeat protein [Butyrivibrio sp. AE3006]
MKKVQATINRVFIALAMAFIMFTGLKATALAAGDEIVVDFTNSQAKALDFSKFMPSTRHVTPAEFDDDSKAVMSLVYILEALEEVSLKQEVAGDMEYTMSTTPNQSIRFYTSGDHMIFYADPRTSVGTYEAVVTKNSMRKGLTKEDIEEVFEMAEYFYGIKATDSNGERYFKVKLLFQNPTSAYVRLSANGTVERIVRDKQFTENNCSYTWINDEEVAFTGVTTKSKSVYIPDTVTHQGFTYKVTKVADKALFNNGKVTSVTVGANVKSIGKSAFEKCKKLKKVKINSTVLSSLGKKAFKKNSAKLTVKLPKAQYRSYKRLFKKAGMASIKLKK